MSHFTNWKDIQVRRSLMPYDNIRKEGNKRQEGRPEDVYSPPGQALQKGEGAQSTEDKTKEAGEDKAAEQGPSLSKAELHKDAKGKWMLPLSLGPVYPPLISSTKSFLTRDVSTAGLPQRGPFQHFMNKKVEKRLASWKERCSLYGDVDMHKYDQSGQVFTPFQVLTTTVSLGENLRADSCSCGVQRHNHFKERKRCGEKGGFLPLSLKGASLLGHQ
uniref:Uncharacterized protein n=1 Tax=Theropithecus gelada TaxID=9565 RepID=A0A8D2G447_THEGE